MPLRSVLTAMILTATTAVPALAFDISAMSDNDRTLFRSEIRDYLLENPEVLMEAIAVLEERRAEEAAQTEVRMLEDNHEAIFNDGYSYVGGNPDGDVTIVEFLDYRCGYCKRAHPAVEELIASDGNIRYIVKEFPILGEESVIASRYAISVKNLAGDAAYKTAHDRLMTHNGAIAPGYLARLSRELGVDHDDVLVEMESDTVNRVIADTRALGERLQFQGTPSFVMGDVFVRGFIELPQMRSMVAAIRRDQG